MRCLIPIHQEYYPKNSLKRAEKLCDEVILLYILDKKVIEKVKSESSYILPSYSLDTFENFVINIHKEEAEKIKNSMKNKDVDLKFVVGEYYESIEKEVLRSTPDLVMCDSHLRAFLNIEVPIWIDRGKEIKECTIEIHSLRKIERIKHAIEFTKKICKRINADFYIYYPLGDDEGLKALKPMGKIVSLRRGKLIALLKDNLLKIPEDKSLILL